MEKKRLLLYTHELSYTGAPTSLLRMCKVLKDLYYIEVWSKQEGGYAEEFEKLGISVKVISERELAYHVEEIKTFDLAIANTIVSYYFYDICRKYIRTVWYIREAKNIPDILGQNDYWTEIVKSADKLYSVSEYAAEFIRETYNPSVEVVHNCVEDRWNGDYKIRQEDEDTVTFLMLGTISIRKGYDLAVKAFEKLDDEYKKKVRIVFAGAARKAEENDPTIKYVFDMVKRYPNIEFVGEKTDRADITELYAQSDVVLVPSRDESCSLVVLEGTMMGKAVVASSNVGAKYIVQEGNGFVFENESVDELSDIYTYFVDNQDKLYDMGKKSRALYEELANMDYYSKSIREMVEKELNADFDATNLERNRCLSDICTFERLFHVEDVVSKRNKQLKKLNDDMQININKLKKKISELEDINKVQKNLLSMENSNSWLRSKHEQDVIEVSESVFFDKEWYENRYPEWVKYPNAAEHYYYEGWLMNYDPSYAFSTSDYVAANKCSICPLVHFARYKGKVKLHASKLFISEMNAAGIALNMIEQSSLFDPKWYIEQYPYLGIEEEDAARHYYEIGWKVGYNPGPEFMSAVYAGEEGTLKESGIECPLLHYELIGKLLSKKKYDIKLIDKNYSDAVTLKDTAVALCLNKENESNIYSVLMSVFRQNKVAKEIFFCIPLEMYPNKLLDVPKNLLPLLKAKAVKVVYCHDKGSYTVFEALEKEKGFEWLAVLDGKSVCPLSWLEMFAQKRENGDSVFGTKGWFVSASERRDYLLLKDSDVVSADKVNMFCPSSGIILKNSFIKAALDNVERSYIKKYDAYAYMWAYLFENRLNIKFDGSACFSCKDASEKEEFQKTVNMVLSASEKRFGDILSISRNERNSKKIKLVIPANPKGKEYNGDYHYGIAIQEEFERRGYEVDFRYIEDWYKPFDGKYVFVLRGPIEYKCSEENVNIMWNISHPMDVSLDEYASFSNVFIASKPWCEKIGMLLEKAGLSEQCHVQVLQQCSDSNKFYEKMNEDANEGVLFVGMNHPEGRKVVMDLLPCDAPFELYGPRWEKTEYEQYLCGKVVTNDILSKYYNRYSIVLNDTRPEMKENGFVPNRVFDVCMAGGLVITEDDPFVNEIFENKMVTYDGSHEDLINKVEFFMNNRKDRERVVQELQKDVLEKHTFSNRVETIIDEVGM